MEQSKMPDTDWHFQKMYKQNTNSEGEYIWMKRPTHME